MVWSMKRYSRKQADYIYRHPLEEKILRGGAMLKPTTIEKYSAWNASAFSSMTEEKNFYQTMMRLVDYDQLLSFIKGQDDLLSIAFLECVREDYYDIPSGKEVFYRFRKKLVELKEAGFSVKLS